MPANTLLPRAVIGLALIGSALFAAVDAHAGECRTIEHDFDPAGLQQLALDVHVGELDVQPSTNGQIHVEVKVCSRSHWFGLRKSKVDAALLDAEQDGRTLKIRIRQDDYNEDWKVRMPAALALDADLGVGELRIAGLTSDINVDLGVGDATIVGNATDYGNVSGDAGVGDVEIKGEGGRVTAERAAVSDSATWVAGGPSSIDVDVGVGDLTITLE